MVQVGDRVRIKSSIKVYHHPEHRNEPFDIQGLEGEVADIVTQWKGRPVSANFPVQVQFHKKFRVHLRQEELEMVGTMA